MTGYLSGSVEGQQFFYLYQLWTDAAMHAQDLLLDDGRYRHGVEAICEVFP